MDIKKLCLLTAGLFFFVSCEKSEIEKGVPACVEEAIKMFSNAACSEGAHVKEYTFQDETVFVFSQGSCVADGRQEVIDEECNSLGFLGGVAGNYTINGEDFSNATYIRTVWDN